MGILDKIEEAAKELQRTAHRLVVQVQQPRQAPVSYADTVKQAIETAPAQPRRRERTVVISTPEGVLPEDIQGKLQAAVDPIKEGWHIVRHRVTKSAKLALNAATEEQAKALGLIPRSMRWDFKLRYWGGVSPAWWCMTCLQTGLTRCWTQ